MSNNACSSYGRLCSSTGEPILAHFCLADGKLSTNLFNLDGTPFFGELDSSNCQPAGVTNYIDASLRINDISCASCVLSLEFDVTLTNYSPGIVNGSVIIFSITESADPIGYSLVSSNPNIEVIGSNAVRVLNAATFGVDSGVFTLNLVYNNSGSPGCLLNTINIQVVNLTDLASTYGLGVSSGDIGVYSG